MRDEIFDRYLYDIMNKSPEEKEKPESAENSDGGEDMSQVLGEPVNENTDAESIRDLTEKTIRFSKGNVAQMMSAIKKSETAAPIEEEEPEPPVKKRRRKQRVRKANYSAYGGLVLVTLVLCCSLIISLFVIVVGRDFLGIDTNNNVFTLYIQPMTGDYDIYDIADMLEENGIIEYPEVFVRFARLKLGSDPIYPGDIDVMPSMSYSDIIDLMSTSREAHETVTVTIPEGYTIDQAAKLLEENGVCSADDFVFTFNSSLYGLNFENYVSSSGMKYYKYEGFLFPDTYEFYVGDTPYNIVKRIKERTDEVLSADVINRCNELGYTLEQVVTLASILQLESGNPDDMDDIAAVFYNRLKNPGEYPRLQTDTTSRYIENVIKAGTTAVFQEMYDAYDTYVCTGLPVGPICNPGEAAIHAALYPAENNCYFFCSDAETGEFYYAETYEEHQENIEKAGLNA